MAATFVGRDRELGVLAGVRARAVAGRRQLVVVRGESGIGKTWFCEEASAAADRDGFEVVWGRCWPHGGAPALWPWPWPAMLPVLVGPAGAELLAADSGRDRVDPERFTRFAAVSSADVLEARTAAAEAGLVEPGPNEFPCHDLVRQVAIGRFDPAGLLDAHARAAAVRSDAPCARPR